MLDKDSIRAGFVRQRRSLVATSVALFTYYAVGPVTLSQTVKLPPLEATLEHPERLIVGLWIVWAYFLLRYGEFLHDLGDERGFRQSFENILTRYARRTVETDLRREWREKHEGLRRIVIDLDTFQPNIISRRLFQVSIRGGIYHATAGESVRQELGKQSRSITGWPLRWDRLFARTHWMLGTTVATEYVLPFLIALAPVAAWAVQWWGRA